MSNKVVKNEHKAATKADRKRTKAELKGAAGKQKRGG